MTKGQAVTVSYAPDDDAMTASSGAMAAAAVAFSGKAVTNETGRGPEVASASVNGATLTVTFDETLGAAASLANDAFTVKRTRHNGAVAAAGLSTTVAPSISGATLTLTLAEALASTDRDVKVSYAAPDTGTDNRLRDLAGNAAASFTDQAVANATPGRPRPLPACGLTTGTVVRPEHFTLTATASTIEVSYTDQIPGDQQAFYDLLSVSGLA